MSEVEAMLKEYEELGNAGSYFQTTARARQNAKSNCAAGGIATRPCSTIRRF